MKCFECGSMENLVEHHVIPQSRGGTKTVILCQNHHDIAHDIKPRDISISALTKEGLERARQRGVKLGNPNLSNLNRNQNKALENSKRAIQERKNRFALFIYGLIQTMATTSLNQIAKNLNFLGQKTRMGGKWTATAVKRVLNNPVVKQRMR